MVTTRRYLPIDPTPTAVFQLSERSKSKLDLSGGVENEVGRGL